MIKTMETSRLEEWIGSSVKLKSILGNSEGRIRYGTRILVAPIDTPFIDYDFKSGEIITKYDLRYREIVEEQNPGYWFVSEQHTGMKIRLNLNHLTLNDNSISDIVDDNGRSFRVKIEKRE